MSKIIFFNIIIKNDNSADKPADQYISNLKELKLKIDESKKWMDDPEINPNELAKFLTLFDPYSYLKSIIKKDFNGENVSNAWLKMYEFLIIKGALLFDTDEYTIFFNAELPGSFIFATNHYVNTFTNKKMLWCASSYYPTDKNTALEDRYGLYSIYRDKWFMREEKDYDGDLTNPKVIDNITKWLKSKINNGVMLYTSDAGIDIGNDYNNQETLNGKIHYGQLISGLFTLGVGGNMIIKYYTISDLSTISSLCLMYDHFEETYIVKPKTSRRHNSEVYFYGCGFKGISDDKVKILLNYVDNFNPDNQIPGSDLKPGVVKSIYVACKEIFNTQIKELDFIKNEWMNNKSNVKKINIKHSINWIKEMSIQKLNLKKKLII